MNAPGTRGARTARRARRLAAVPPVRARATLSRRTHRSYPSVTFVTIRPNRHAGRRAPGGNEPFGWVPEGAQVRGRIGLRVRLVSGGTRVLTPYGDSRRPGRGRDARRPRLTRAPSGRGRGRTRRSAVPAVPPYPLYRRTATGTRSRVRQEEPDLGEGEPVPVGRHPAGAAQRDHAPVAGHRPGAGRTPAPRAAEGLGRPHSGGGPQHGLRCVFWHRRILTTRTPADSGHAKWSMLSWTFPNDHLGQP